MWFSHPKPFITKAVAMQMAEQKTLPPPDTTSITVERHDAAIPTLREREEALEGPAAPISLSVAFKLREYLDFRWAESQAGKNRARLPSAVAGALWYYLRIRHLRASDISIDERGIQRSGAAGTSVWSWRDVREVRPYPSGYLLRLDGESISIPYRYLNAGQRTRIRAMILNCGGGSQCR